MQETLKKSWPALRDFGLVGLGTLIQAIGLRIFRGARQWHAIFARCFKHDVQVLGLHMGFEAGSAVASE